MARPVQSPAENAALDPGSDALEVDDLKLGPTGRHGKGNGGGGGGVGGEGGRKGCSLTRLLACITSQQHASVSQGRICSDIRRAVTLRQKLQISPTHSMLRPGPHSSSAEPCNARRRAGQSLEYRCSSHWYGMTWKKALRRTWDSNPGSSALEADALTTRPTRWMGKEEGRDACSLACLLV